MPELLREPQASTSRIRSLHPCQDDQPRRPLHQRVDGRLIASPFDEVAFPVAGYGTGRHFGRTLGHRRHGGDLAAPIRPSRLTPRRQQCAPQRTAWQYIQAHLDRLSRQLFAHVVRIRVFETPGNLLRRAALDQMRPHVLPQPRVHEFA